MILLFGPPGSGKSIQGRLLVKRNGWELVSTGELFRRSKDPMILQRLARGDLIDDAVTNSVVNDAMENIPNNAEIVIDGYPRNVSQAQWLAENTTHHQPIKCVVVLDIPVQQLTKRLANRGRPEDLPEIMKHRLSIYDNKTSPLMNFYRDHNVPVMVIDGVGSVEEVNERIQLAVMTCLATE